jgi:predicted nucleic acid-binding protein
VTAFVVDASVVIKWVVQEEGSDAAVRLIEGPTLSAPDLLIPECANILWKKVRREELTREEAKLAAELLIRADIELVPTRALMSAALRLAVDLGHAAYDCMYLALAMERGDTFVTADAKFARLVARVGGSELGGKVVELGAVGTWDA